MNIYAILKFVVVAFITLVAIDVQAVVPKSCPTGQSWQCEPGLRGKPVCGCMPDAVPPPPPPTQPQPLRVGKITAGPSRTCALTNKSSVRCWGPGPTYDRNVDIETNVADIAGSAFGDALCMIKVDRTLKCIDDRNILTIETGKDDLELQNVSAVALGRNDACALINNSVIRCWGAGNITGHRFDSYKHSWPVTNFGGGSDIAVSGSEYSADLCAVSGGSVWCVGNNLYSGQGIVNIPQPTYVSYVVAQKGGFCANGVVATCWDRNMVYQAAVRGVEHIAVGGNSNLPGQNVCAIDSSGLASCWDEVVAPFVGGPPPSITPSHNPVSQLTNFRDISVGGSFTCAVDVLGAVFCWWSDPNRQTFDSGELGGSNVLVRPPIAVPLN